MAEKTIYDDLQNIHEWRKYSPSEIQYLRYPTNIIFSAIKLTDIYAVLCIARANLNSLSYKNFGDYAGNETAITFIKATHIQYSLIYYNIAVDYSWQLLWLYYDAFLSGESPTTTLYEECIKSCNYEELLMGLTLRQDIKMRDGIVKNFFEKNQAYNKIRPLYNYLKHRGTYYFDGLGLNEEKMIFDFRKGDVQQSLPLITRKELKIQETKEHLIEFDKAFVEYMSLLIHLLIPEGFENNSIPLSELLTCLQNYH